VSDSSVRVAGQGFSREIPRARDYRAYKDSQYGLSIFKVRAPLLMRKTRAIFPHLPKPCRRSSNATKVFPILVAMERLTRALALNLPPTLGTRPRYLYFRGLRHFSARQHPPSEFFDGFFPVPRYCDHHAREGRFRWRHDGRAHSQPHERTRASASFSSPSMIPALSPSSWT